MNRAGVWIVHPARGYVTIYLHCLIIRRSISTVLNVHLWGRCVYCSVYT